MDDHGTLVASTFDLELCNGGYRFRTEVPLFLGQGTPPAQRLRGDDPSGAAESLVERHGQVVGNLKYERGNYSPADHSYVWVCKRKRDAPAFCGFTTSGRDGVPLGDVPRRRLVGGGARTTSMLFEWSVSPH